METGNQEKEASTARRQTTGKRQGLNQNIWPLGFRSSSGATDLGSRSLGTRGTGQNWSHRSGGRGDSPANGRVFLPS